MNEEDVKKLCNVRKTLVLQYEKLRDYKTNQNALMKEIDHAKWVHNTIVEIDKVLKNYVNFS